MSNIFFSVKKMQLNFVKRSLSCRKKHVVLQFFVAILLLKNSFPKKSDNCLFIF